MLNGARINYATDLYDPVKHTPLILQKILHFKSTENNLLAIDGTTALVGMGGTTFLWFASASFLAFILFAIALTVKQEMTDRAVHRQKFLEELAELQEIYKWCCRTGNKKVLEDGAVLELLDAIAPFTRDKNTLIPKNCSHSKMFREIMSQPPHNMYFDDKIEDKKAQPAGLLASISFPFFQSAGSEEVGSAPVIVKEGPAPHPSLSFFADLRLYRYGEESKQADNKNSKTQMLQELAAPAIEKIRRGLGR